MATKKQKSSALFSAAFSSVNEVVDRSWSDADPNLVARLVAAVVDFNGMVSFNATRDGGALVVSFFHDLVPKDKRKQYCPGNQDIDDFLRYWADFWEQALEADRDSRASEKG